MISLLAFLAYDPFAHAAAISWDGEGDGINWSNPPNWSTNTLPGAADDVTIDVTGTLTVFHASGTTSIKSLQCEENLDITGGSFTLTDASVINGTLDVRQGASLTVSGAAVSLTANGATTATGANLYAQSGATFALPGLTTLRGATGAYTYVSATGADSIISMPNVTNVIGGTSSNWRLFVTASSGGLIDLSGAVTLEAQIHALADGSGSAIDLSSVDTFSGSIAAHDAAKLMVRNGGTLDLTSLSSVASVGFEATNTISGRTTTLTLPALISIAGNSIWNDQITATGESSTLNFPSVASIIGLSSGTLYVTASSGGSIDLASATSLVSHIQVLADGAGSSIDLSALTTFTNAINGHDGAKLSVRNGGTLNVDGLANVTGGGFEATNTVLGRTTTLTLPALTSITGPNGGYNGYITATGESSALNFPGVLSVSGSGGNLFVTASSGGIIDLASATSLDSHIRALADGTGSSIDLSAVATFTNAVNGHDGARLMVREGGTLDLTGLTSVTGVGFEAANTIAGRTTTLTLPALATITGQGSGYKVYITSTGESSTLSFPAVTTLVGGVSVGGTLYMTAASRGEIHMPAVEVMAAYTDISIQGATLSLHETQATELLGIPVTMSSPAGQPGTLNGFTIDLNPQSSLSGAGIINGTLLSEAPISPERVITINGDFIQNAGLLNIDLAGTLLGVQYDQLAVTGQATLNTGLAISVVSPFVPDQTGKFDVLTFASRTGSFAPVNGLNLVGGAVLKTIYRPNKLVIGELAGLITPPVPTLSTLQNVSTQIDLTPYEGDAVQPDWDIASVNNALYAASIDVSHVLTVSPVLNAFGVDGPTLTLTDLSDGFDDSQVLDISVSQVLPTGPFAAVVFPANPIETENLFCAIQGGTVANLLSKQYKYVWTSSPGVKMISHGPTVLSFDTLAATNTAPGEVWTCTVTTWDGLYDSPTSTQGVSDEVLPLSVSTLTLNLDPSAVTLGQAVAVSGSVSPAAPGENIFFDDSVPPSVAGTKPSTMSTNGSSQFGGSFLPNEAGIWTINAHWNGNLSLLSDTDARGFSVAKAQPSIALSLSVSSAPVGFDELTAIPTLTAALPAELQTLLGGRDIKLFLRKPDATVVGPVTVQTNASGVATFTPTHFSNAGVQFNDPGTWQLLAEFPGDSNLLQTTSTGYDQPGSARLTIKDGAGYAVVVVGQLDENAEGQAEHAHTAEFVYRALRDRGLADEDIYFMSSVAPGAGVVVDDASPTQVDMQNALATWAKNKMNAAPGPLYVVLLDHGSVDKFFMYSGVYNPTRIVTPTELGGYLDTLQSGLTGEAANSDIVLVYGACYSGTYIGKLSAPNRVIITSASADEISHRGTLVPGSIRDGEPFVTELFRGLRDGKSIKAAFETASILIEEYTASSTNGGGGSLPQRPRLDDNGDGAGTLAPYLSFGGGADGARSHELALGFGANASPPVGWIEATQTLIVGPSDPVDLFARASEAPSTGHTTWMEIKPPIYAGAIPASVASGPNESYANFQQVVPLTRQDPGNTDPGDGRYEWNGVEGLFVDPGTYKVYYFIEDGDTGETAAHLVTTVYRTLASNNPPQAVTLEYPSDGATTSTQTFFVWTASVDPDPGAVITYRIELATDAGFTQDYVRIDGITHTFTQVPGLTDGATYYWRVTPFDEYGASPAANPTATVSFNNGNPALPGAISGTVVHACTGLGLAGVNVHATNLANAQDTATTLTDAQGAFLLKDLSGDNYQLDVTMSGFTSHQMATVTIISGGNNEIPVELVPVGVVCEGVIGDVNLDGSVNALDATLISLYILLGYDVDTLNTALQNAGLNPFQSQFADVDRVQGVKLRDATLVNAEQLMGKGALNAYLGNLDPPQAPSHTGEPL